MDAEKIEELKALLAQDDSNLTEKGKMTIEQLKEELSLRDGDIEKIKEKMNV